MKPTLLALGLATLFAASPASAHLNVNGHQCDIGSDWAVRMHRRAFVFSRDEHKPAEIGIGGGRLFIDGKEQTLSEADHARLRQFESRFSQEPSDPAAAKVEDDMLVGMTDDQLAGAEIVPRDPDVKCRRDTCRITANFRSSSDASDWAVLYVTLMGSNYVTSSQPVFVKAADGSTQMRLFASRKAPAGAR